MLYSLGTDNEVKWTSVVLMSLLHKFRRFNSDTARGSPTGSSKPNSMPHLPLFPGSYREFRTMQMSSDHIISI
jgi:hypothetical protein